MNENQKTNYIISQVKKELLFAHSIQLFSTISIVVGGTLIARTIWEFVFKLQGPVVTILLGVIMLAIGGIIVHRFNPANTRKDPLS